MRVALEGESYGREIVEVDSVKLVGTEVLLFTVNGSPYCKVNCWTNIRASEALDGLFEHGRFDLTRYDCSYNV